VIHEPYTRYEKFVGFGRGKWNLRSWLFIQSGYILVGDNASKGARFNIHYFPIISIFILPYHLTAYENTLEEDPV
jgi:hypothetical protein